ncbi:MAG TPA: Ig-like domain-containing protein [Longimicrobiales bacterium]|nr:Ig-like domain-containing protein [Longimicrobiales bacterium]
MAVTLILVATACESDPATRTVEVEVVSAIDTIIPLGFSAELTATARDARDNPVGATFDWSSSDPRIASVSLTGEVLAVGPGRAIITAAVRENNLVGPSGTASGSIPIRVVDADTEAIQALLSDPLVPHLIGGLGPTKGAIETALDACDSGITSGNLMLVIGCTETVRTQAGAAAGTDRALLATLTLMTDFAVLMLNLEGTEQ